MVRSLYSLLLYLPGTDHNNLMQSRALDINRTYTSFALASRIPACLMFFSAVALMGFLAAVAYDAAPVIVWIVCSGVVVGMSGQFVVWGIVRVVRGVGWCVRAVGRGVRCGVRAVVGAVGRVTSGGRSSQTGAGGGEVTEEKTPNGR